MHRNVYSYTVSVMKILAENLFFSVGISLLFTASADTFAQITTTPSPVVQAMNWDASIVYDLNQHSQMKALSHVVSDALYPISGAMPLGFYVGGVFAKDRYAVETGLMLTAVEISTFLSVVALKQLIARDRPYVAYPNDIKGGEDDPLKSFPSGHSAFTTALTTFISLRYPHWYVIAPLSLYTVYTYYARINLGMHYPTDIIAGAIIGGAFGILGNYLLPRVSNSINSLIPDDVTMMVQPRMNFFSLSLPL
jgi:hypothetical protein